jgi:hypothetical protein
MENFLGFGRNLERENLEILACKLNQSRYAGPSLGWCLDFGVWHPLKTSCRQNEGFCWQSFYCSPNQIRPAPPPPPIYRIISRQIQCHTTPCLSLDLRDGPDGICMSVIYSIRSCFGNLIWVVKIGYMA